MLVYPRLGNIIQTTRFRIINTVRVPRLTSYATYKRLVYSRFFDMIPINSNNYSSNRPGETIKGNSSLEQMILNDELSDVENGINEFTRIHEACKIVLRVSVNFTKTRKRRGKDVLIGVYVPSNNVLITGDWSHTAYGVQYVENFIANQLIERLGLVEIERRIERKRRRPQIAVTIGADPEYELIDLTNNTVIRASGRIMSERHGAYGGIGLDGAGSQVELRPTASEDVDVVVNNLAELVKRFYVRHPNSQLGVAGHVFPLGGHIHVGVSRSYDPPKQLLSILDDFVGIPTINLSGSRRAHYKKLSAVETKHWGFEYRTPPAIVFQNPEITRVVFKIVKNIVNKYLNVPKKPFVYKYPVTTKELMEIAKLSKEEAEFYLYFIERAYQRVGLMYDRICLENWFTDMPKVLTDPKAELRGDEPDDDDDFNVEEAIRGDNRVSNREARIARNSDVRVSHSRLMFTFNDEWLDRCKSLLIEMFEGRISPTGTPFINITFFGYRKARGWTSNLRMNEPNDSSADVVREFRIRADREANNVDLNTEHPLEPGQLFRSLRDIDPPINSDTTAQTLTARIGLPYLIRMNEAVMTLMKRTIATEVLRIIENALSGAGPRERRRRRRQEV